ncbi:MAG: hypothetical protein KC933_35135 [Myxococcales bacterium]|nr:hypothetical protein [Myxococcales bacterium]MCB9652411.1 hypothetical protein [Deltaproteobacteria bacterium]
MVIPSPWDDFRAFWERLPDCRTLSYELRGEAFTAFVQPPRPGFVYPCTPDDVFHLLSLLPAPDIHDLRAVIFRQPTKKQVILSSVWGRLGYSTDVGPYHGPAIVIEAMPLGRSVRWPRSLTLDDQRELARLEEDGHRITQDKRGFLLAPSSTSLRNGVLFRTVLHEVGHWVDYLEKVERPGGEAENFDELEDRYRSRPAREREEFAHAYAERMARQLRDARDIPFAPLGMDEVRLGRLDLAATAFAAGHAPESTSSEPPPGTC